MCDNPKCPIYQAGQYNPDKEPCLSCPANKSDGMPDFIEDIFKEGE